jgi:hypothetical protein
MSLAHIVFSITLVVLGAGLYLVTVEKRKLIGWTLVIASIVAIAACTPGLLRELPGAPLNTNGGGGGGSYAGGGGGGKGAPGGVGGTYIQNQYNYGQSTPAPTTVPAHPDVTLRFINPTEPALQLVNQSGVTARDIKWMVTLWNLDLPNRTNPLPIPTAAFDFIMPHSPGGPQGLFDAPMVASLLHPGDHLIGSASVSCPDCVRGRTFIVYIILGHDGWFTEVLDKMHGEVLVPKHPTKSDITKYAD